MKRDLDLTPMEKAPTLKEQAYERIKELFLQRKIRAGEIISAARLAEALQISRTPVREALLDLQHEGLVEVVPRRGIVVRSVTESETAELFWLRRAIEGAVVREIAPRFSDEDAAAIRVLIERQRVAMANEDRRAFLEADAEFHLELARKTGYPRLVDILMNLRDLTQLIGSEVLALGGRAQAVIDEHLQILSALEERDADKASEAMIRHLTSTERTYVSARREGDGSSGERNHSANR